MFYFFLANITTSSNFYTHLKKQHPDAHKKFKAANEENSNQQSVQEIFGVYEKYRKSSEK